jgi:large subunit ribosomal protein L4
MAEQLKLYSIESLGTIPTLAQASAAEFSNCIRVLMQNWRQGTLGCKNRAIVWKTNKKPWKQKGTGRARAGSAKSPLWRGGGIIFGPQPRTRKMFINQGTNKRVMVSLAQNYISAGKVGSLDWDYEGMKPSTASAYKALVSAGLNNKKILVLTNPNDILLHASFVNIPFVSLMFFDQPNVFQLANSDFWVYVKRDEQQFSEMVKRWI